MPVLDDESLHWFPYLVNVQQKITYLLDSLPSTSEAGHKRKSNLCEKLLSKLHDIFKLERMSVVAVPNF
ncbi:unnamed protein product, partial [Linum tenue]